MKKNDPQPKPAIAPPIPVGSPAWGIEDVGIGQCGAVSYPLRRPVYLGTVSRWTAASTASDPVPSFRYRIDPPDPHPFARTEFGSQEAFASPSEARDAIRAMDASLASDMEEAARQLRLRPIPLPKDPLP